MQSGGHGCAGSLRGGRDSIQKSKHSPAVAKAARLLVEQLEGRVLLSGITVPTLPTWTEIGPAPIGDSRNVRVGPGSPTTGPAAGSVQSIAVDPHDPNRLFVGTANGGVWKTTDATADNPDWTPLTDGLQNFAIGSVAISPIPNSSGAYNTIFAGLGSYSSYLGLGNTGGGVLRSTDGGNSWRIFARSTFASAKIRQILPTDLNGGASGLSHQFVYVAASSGLYLSIDGGATFTHVHGSSGHSLPSSAACDAVIAVPNTSPVSGESTRIIYAAFPNHGVFVSRDNAVTWDMVDAADAGPNGMHSTDQQMRLAAWINPDTSASASPHYTIFAGVIGRALTGHGTDRIVKAQVFRSDDGADWHALGAQVPFDAGPDINFSLAADQGVDGVVYAGGTTHNTVPFVGDLQMYSVSDSAWHSIVLSGANNTAPHADSHVLALADGHGIFEGDDGGIYKLTTIGPTARWVSMNGSTHPLNVTEVTSVADDTANNQIFAGSQDNGAFRQTTATTPASWITAVNGDGGDQAVDMNGPLDSSSHPTIVHYYVGNNFDSIYHTTLSETGATVSSFAQATLRAAGSSTNLSGLLADDNPGDDTPLLLKLAVNAISSIDPHRPSPLLLGYRGLYESLDGGDTITQVSSATDLTFTALAYGGRSGGIANPGFLLAGGFDDSGAPRLFSRGTAGAGLNDLSSSFPGVSPTAITIDPDDWHIAYISTLNGSDDHPHVWRIQLNTDGTAIAASQDITNDLKYYLNTIDSIQMVHVNGGKVLLIGAKNGVFRCMNPDGGAAAEWTILGAGLPRARVMDMAYDAPRHRLIVGTLGRGIWTFDDSSAQIIAPTVLRIAGAPGDNAFYLKADPSNVNVQNIYTNSTGTGTPAEVFNRAKVTKIEVDSGTGINVNLTIDETNGPVKPAGPDGFQFVDFDASKDHQNNIAGSTITTVTAVQNAASGVATVAAALAQNPSLNQTLPVANRPMGRFPMSRHGQGIDPGGALTSAPSASDGDGSDAPPDEGNIADVVDQGLVNPLDDFVGEVDEPSPISDDIATFLSNLSTTFATPAGQLVIGVDPTSVQNLSTSSTLEFTLTLQADLEQTLSIDLTSVPVPGLQIDASATLDFHEIVAFNFTFGYHLTAGLNAGQAFFFTPNSLTLGATAHASNLTFGVNVGVLDAHVNHGSIDINAGLRATFPGGTMTGDQINGTSPSGLASFSVAKPNPSAPMIDVNLPVTVNLAGFTSTPGHQPTIRITADNIFAAPPTISVTDFDHLIDFSNIGPQNLLALVRQVESTLTTLGGSGALNTQIPFTHATIGSVLHVAEDFANRLTALTDSSGNVTFGGVSDFINHLTTGLPPGLITAQYVTDPVHPALEVTISPPDASFSTSVSPELDASIGSLASITVSGGNITVSGSAHVGITFGIDLSQFGPQEVGVKPVVANGHIPSDLHGTITVGHNAPIPFVLTAAATAGNHSPADLAPELAAALSSALLSAGSTTRVTVSLRGGNTLEIDPATASADQAIRLAPLTPGDPAFKALGLSSGALDPFFFQDASIGGHLTASVSGLNATAQLSIFNLSVTGASGSATIGATVSLGPPHQRVLFSDLLADLAGSAPAGSPPLVNFALTGNAHLNVPVSVRDGSPSSPPLATASLTIDLNDINHPENSQVNFTGPSNPLAGLSHLGLVDVIHGLSVLVDYLHDLTSNAGPGSFLSQKLPLINQSISDLVDYADRFTTFLDGITHDPAGTFSGIVTQINSTLVSAFSGAGFTLGTTTPLTVSLADGGQSLKFDLHLTPNFSTSVPINLDLSPFQSGPLHGLLDLNVDGSASASFGADLNLDLGIDLNTAAPFLGDDTALTFSGTLGATIAHASASAGPFSFTITGGSATLGGATAGHPAQFHIGLHPNTNPSAHHHYLFSDLLSGATPLDGLLSASFVGHADINLPCFFPDAGSSIGALHIGVDLGIPPTFNVISTPHFPDLSSFAVSGDLGSMIDGLDRLLGLLENTLNSDIFSGDLPLIGDSLKTKNIAAFIGNFRTSVLAPLRTLSNAQRVTTIVQQLLHDVLASGDSTLTLPGGRTIPIHGLGLLAAGKDVTVLSTASDNVEFEVPLGTTIDLGTSSISLALGLPALGLNINAAIHGSISVNLNLAFGVSRADGFYLDTGTDSHSQPLTGLSARIDVTLPTIQAGGTLAFLAINAGLSDPLDPTRPALAPPHLSGTFSASLTSSGPSHHLGYAQLSSGSFDLGSLLHASLSASANADLYINGGISDGHGGVLDVLPEISTHFHLAWTTGIALIGGGTPGTPPASAPTVQFQDVRLYVGSFFTTLAGPVLQEINAILQPIRPVLDFLEQPLPVLSDLVGHPVTMLDVAATLGSVDPAFIHTLADIVDIVSTVSQLAAAHAPNLYFSFGSITVAGADQSVTPGGPPPTLSPAGGFPSAPDLMGQASSFGGSYGAMTRTFLTESQTASGGGLQFPLLHDPSKIFGILLGQDADLVTFDSPTLRVGFSYSQFIPIYGPIGVDLEGSLAATAHFKIGYDTRGVRDFVTDLLDSHANPDELPHPLKLLDGFYVDTSLNPTTHVPVSNVSVTGSISAGAGVNLGIAEAEINGGVSATVSLSLHDPNNDGKLRLDEIGSALTSNPLSLFNASGEVDAFLGIHARFLLFTYDYQLAHVKLLDFTVPLGGAPAAPAPATLTGSVLSLKDTSGDDTITVDATSPIGSDGKQTIVVTSGNNTASFSGVSSINFISHGGNDSVTVRSANDSSGGSTALYAVMLPVVLTGGSGNDTFTAGAGASDLVGGGGNDVLTGGPGACILDGGAGNDRLVAGSGPATLKGGAGDDQITGSALGDSIDGGEGNNNIDAGDGNNTITAGAGDDIIRSGSGHDVINAGNGNNHVESGGGIDAINTGSGADFIAGGLGADVINSGAGDDSIFGDAGDDSINAGGGDDFVDASDRDPPNSQASTKLHGSDNDSVQGGLGDDVIIGGIGNDNLNGGAGNDSITGGDGNDSLSGDGSDAPPGPSFNKNVGQPGGDSLDGGAGNDSISGNYGDDILIGGDGNDTMLGGGSYDSLDGGAGSDSLRGGDGNDLLYAGDGDRAPLPFIPGDTNSLLGDGGDDSLRGSAGANILDGGDGNDSIVGGSAGNVITGDNGDDALFGGPGADSLNGGAGNDIVHGREGNDTELGAAGNDSIFGDKGNDALVGGAAGVGLDGNDSLMGNDGNDLLLGGNATLGVTLGTYTLNGGTGNDLLDGGIGNDSLVAQQGNDILLGGAGDDEMIGGMGNDSLDGGVGNDVLLGDQGTIVDVSQNGSNKRVISSDSGYATATIFPAGSVTHFVTLINSPAGGNDSLIGGAGNDILHGGAGNDLLTAGASVSTSADGNDALFGDAGNDSLLGGRGKDHLYGGADNDKITAHAGGASTISGGSGNDFLASASAADRIFDWTGPGETGDTFSGSSAGLPTFITDPSSGNRQFLLDLGNGDGATDAAGELSLPPPPTPPSDLDELITTANFAKVGATVINTISDPTDVDIYAFSTVAKQTLFIDVQSGNGSTLLPYLRLFDPNGNPITAAKSLAGDASLQFTFANSGIFYVGVSASGNTAYDVIKGAGDKDGGSSGKYIFSIKAVIS